MANKLSENKKLLVLGGMFLFAYFVPFAHPRVSGAISESFLMLSEYAKDHVLLCLVPAFFIAGAIQVFINQQSVITYLGPKAKKVVAYSVASVSGGILAVCSCTVLPLFRGIYKKGAGLGPAVSFLYSGPAINVLAITLTAKVLGWKIGLARAVMAILFSVIIGYIMHLIFKKEDEKRIEEMGMFKQTEENLPRKLWQNSIYMGLMIAILVFVNWSTSGGDIKWWDFIFSIKYIITGLLGLFLLFILFSWFRKYELKEWVVSTRDFAIQILPLLFIGVLVAGFLLGRPGHKGIISTSWVGQLVGGNSLFSNFISSISGAFMYFATLTEVPILQTLMGAGMGQGPALALLLAGPSLSLPSMIVIKRELGWKKTITYVAIVIVLSTFVGMAYGSIVS
jgi:uncharacterized membrane protein YraQ (UPF0718 family)